MNFGETLGKLREKTGLTQAALAEKAGLSLRTVQAWEQGRRSPVSSDFFRLVKALGVSCEAFAPIEGSGRHGAAARPRKGASKGKGK
jgi:transcriptional regulator with XRE-family HTH domain